MRVSFVLTSRGRLWLNQHSSCTTNVYKLDADAGEGSIQTCGSMRLGALSLRIDSGLLNSPTIKLGKLRYHLYWVELTINQQLLVFVLSSIKIRPL